MAKKARISRTKQRRIQQRVLNHEHEKAQAFLGSAKIDIVHLCFDDALGRAPDKKNDEFLLDSFRRHGCEQLNSAYRVPATIHAGILQTALSRSNLTPAQLLERDPALLPLLHLPHGTRIQCFLGAHRIRAAQQVLPRDQQWWVVDLYPDDISSELQVSLSQQGSNERRLNEGEVLCRIIKARVHLQSDQEDFWWTRLPSGEQKCQAERLLSRRDFRTVLGRLSDIPALFLDFLTGMVGALLRLKCDEEILHGWRRIEQCWTSLLTEDTVALGKLEHEDVKALQLRCPALYQADRALLEPLFQKGQILRQFSPAEREQIWHRLLQYQALVPSFHSFFGNLHYLAAIASCLKLLVHLDYRQTVADAFEAAFSSDRAALADDARVGEVSLSSTNSRANVAYRQVVLHIMQQLLLLRSESILTGTGPKLTRALGGPAKQRLAVIAQQHGFRSASIDQLISHDPDREVAREVLLAVRAAVTTDCSEARMAPLVDQIVKVFAEFRRQTTPLAPLSWAPLDEEGEESGEEVEEAGGRDGEIQTRSLDHRRGLPSRHAYEQSCHALTFAQIHAPVPDGLTGPSAFLIQRDIYLFFYGDLNPSPTAAISAVAAGNIRAALTSTPVQETTLHETGATEAMDVSEDFPNETTSTALTLYQEPPGTVPTTSVNTNSIYTDASLPASVVDADNNDDDGNDGGDDDDDVLAEAAHTTDAAVVQYVQFMLYDQGSLRVVRVEPLGDGAENRVERAARGFMQQGLVVSDGDSHSVAPAQCLRSALHDSRMAVYLVPEGRLNQMEDLDRALRGVKRSGNGDVDEQFHPRKLQVLGDTRPRELVPVHTRQPMTRKTS